MSIALYRYRVYWDGHHGAVRYGDDTRILVERPALRATADGAELEEIDYAPEVDVAQVREREGEWRDMTAEEVAAAEALMASIVQPPWAIERAA